MTHTEDFADLSVVWSDHVLGNELRQFSRILADAEDKVHAALFADLFQTLEHPLAVIQVGLDKLLERVDKNLANVEVLAGGTAGETHEHLVAFDVVFIGIDKAHVAGQIEHIAIIVIDENDVVLGILGSSVGHFNDPLGLSGTLFTGNYLNQWERLLMFCFFE